MHENKFAAIFKQNAIWLVFILEIIIFAIANEGTFTTQRNLINISRQVSYYGIASIGMTFVILIAGIDLSIGSIITLILKELLGIRVNKMKYLIYALSGFFAGLARCKELLLVS